MVYQGAWDHMPDALVGAIEAAWACRIFNHYGMTKMGLGDGVERAARSGYHRKNELKKF